MPKQSGIQPVPSYPQLSIFTNDNIGIVEYRVKNWVYGKDEQPRSSVWMYIDILVILVALFYDGYKNARPETFKYFVIAGLIWWKSQFIVWESVVAIPGYGIQLETHRGFPQTAFTPPIPLTCSRTFVHVAAVADIFLNEGLQGWTVRYYLAVAHRLGTESGQGGENLKMAVAFENIKPPGIALREVYHGVRETVYDDFDDS